MDLRDHFEAPAPAIVLAEGEFGTAEGKTANGIVTSSEVFETRVVVDSETAGRSASDVLENRDAPDVPIVESVGAALTEAPEVEALVIGVAPAGGNLPEAWVDDIETAIRAGCDVVSGLHVFLSEDEHWTGLADRYGTRLFDVRKPPGSDDLRVGDGSVDDVDADVVLTLGTDCAVGKRTTTYLLYRAAREAGYDAGWVATGQTGIMIGAHEGVVIDRVPADFTAGVVEDMVTAVGEAHELVFVEGQAALTHRAYSGVTLSLLHGCWPDAVVIADDPDRRTRTHFDSFEVSGVDAEVRLVEDLSDADVAAISTWGDSETEGSRHDLPVANVYEEGGTEALLAAVTGTLGGETDRAGSGE
ncbi:DUF1611 domain-containing protein [Haloplanus halophilus]|uniref:DUF1611 domain-containing protein n=1 Tax=Haloplanus halophilus TaxID=2949993 RepID=UPI00203BF1B8|nr:DUF1611 domain-containing protein [Haloplanus sp. GDY1]